MKVIKLKISFKLLALLWSINSINAEGQNPKIVFTNVDSNCYVYTTYKNLGSSPFPSNGMYIVTEKGVVLIDSPWDTTCFQALLDTIWSRHQSKVVMAIATHFHDDRTAGVYYFKTQGIKTWASKMTYDLCKEKNEKQPEFYFNGDTTFVMGNTKILCHYPGPGHTQDNIVVWLEKEKLLYGGCLVKSTESAGIGYTGDANLIIWPKTLKKLKNKFKKAKYIIPGHQGWKNPGLVHSLRLLRKHN